MSETVRDRKLLKFCFSRFWRQLGTSSLLYSTWQIQTAGSSASHPRLQLAVHERRSTSLPRTALCVSVCFACHESATRCAAAAAAAARRAPSGRDGQCERLEDVRVIGIALRFNIRRSHSAYDVICVSLGVSQSRWRQRICPCRAHSNVVVDGGIIVVVIRCSRIRTRVTRRPALFIICHHAW